MGKSYCPGCNHTVEEGNFCAKTPAYLCGNQPVSQAISAPLRGPNSDTISEGYTRPSMESNTSPRPQQTQN